MQKKESARAAGGASTLSFVTFIYLSLPLFLSLSPLRLFLLLFYSLSSSDLPPFAKHPIFLPSFSLLPSLYFLLPRYSISVHFSFHSLFPPAPRSRSPHTSHFPPLLPPTSPFSPHTSTSVHFPLPPFSLHVPSLPTLFRLTPPPPSTNLSPPFSFFAFYSAFFSLPLSVRCCLSVKFISQAIRLGIFMLSIVHLHNILFINCALREANNSLLFFLLILF